MKKTFSIFGLFGAFVLAALASAHTAIVVTNGPGSYSTNHLAFHDADGTYLVLDGAQGSVTITYPDQTTLGFPYHQTVAGLSVTGSWTGADQSGYVYTATVQEDLLQTKPDGSVRGDGDEAVIVTSLAGGKITYDYAGAYAPPLVAPVITGDSTPTAVTFFWTAAGGGVPPYTYAVCDEDGEILAETEGLTATVTGLRPGTAYTIKVLTTDSAGRKIKSASATVYPLED